MSHRTLARTTVIAAVIGLICLGLSPYSASASAPQEMQYACALKSNGQLRYAATANDCGKNETLVRIKPGPVLVCVQPSGSSRKVSNFRDCKPPALQLTLPPASGVVYFCVTIGTNVLRYVTDPSQCTSSEFAVQVTPNDAAPSVSSTSPANGATQVATNTNIGITFSESVTVSSSSFSLVCGGSAKSFAVSGSPGSSITLDPTADIAQNTSCTVTVIAANVSDTDTNDPPDHPTANYVFSFTTDTAPSVTSTAPANGATNVAVSSNVTVTFSEPVHAPDSAFSLDCGTAQSFTVTGDGTSTFSLDPTSDLPTTSTCTVTVDAASVTDVDAGDPPDTMAANYVFSFTTVDLAPAVVSTSPTDGASSVGTSTTITVNFSEAVTASASSFGLECPSATPVAFTVSGSPGSAITLTPTSSLAAGTTCSVTVVANNVSDVDAVDPPDHPAADYTFSFTTDSAPAVTATSPADGASGVLPGSTITVTFSEDVDVTTASFTLTCDGTPQPFGVSGSGTATITLTPDADLPSTSSCTVVAVAANITDTDPGDPPNNPAADYTFSFTTQDAAPSVTSTTPTDGATNVSRGTTIVVDFSESVQASGSAFALECPTGTPVSFSVTGNPGSSITLTPSSSLDAGVTCTVTVKADQISDTDAIDPPDTMAADYTFSFTTVANSAPTDIALSNSSVDENLASGTSVGTLSTTDPDAGDTFTYAFASGTGDGDNGSFTIDGATLKTNATFDYETKSNYTIRVRSTDSGGLFTEKQFTITVNDVNDAPTDISLTATTIDENLPPATTIGTLGATDQDAGQTFTFSLQSTGCGGGPFPDNASFAVSGTSLKSAVSFNYEVKNSYTICLRVTDSGSPAKSYDEQFTITINNVNDAPVASPDTYSGAIGNTLAVLGTTASGPNVVLTGNVLTQNDTDEDTGDTISAVAESVTSTGGGTATINSDGSFTFLPGVGDRNQDDTFTYHVTDTHVSVAGTVTVHIDNYLVWYVDSASAASSHDGRSTAPYLNLSGLNGAGGSGDADGTGDTIFLYSGTGSYGGGLPLEANQQLLGQPHGLVVNAISLVTAGGTTPVVTNAAGTGLGLAGGVDVEGVNVSGTSGDGVNGSAVTTATVGTTTPVSILNSGADGVDLSGAAGGNISIAATISGSVGRSAAVANRSSGTTAFSGAITGGGISLSSNTGATINFTGGLTITSGATSAFSATGGGIVNVTGSNNALTSTTGTGLNVDNTTIGASGITFKSISSNGAVNGIRLNVTGSSGGLTVSGAGNTSLGGNASGGLITNSTGAGVSLSSTRNVSLNNLSVTNTPNASGIDGTAVTNFSFTNGTVSGSGTTSHGTADSNIGFNHAGTTIDNVDGTLTITNSILSNAYQHGVDVLNYSGTLSSINVSNNSITSPTSAADSFGSGIRVQALGSASGAANITGGTLNTNAVTGFPNGAGIVVLGGNATSVGAPGGNLGTSGAHVQIDSNLIGGASISNRMGTNCILVSLSGYGTGFVDVTNNGTGAQPLRWNNGNCVSVNLDGAGTLTSSITNNVVQPDGQVTVSAGIAGGVDRHTVSAGVYIDGGTMRATVSNNTVSRTSGNGIYLLANGSGDLLTRVQNNTVSEVATASSTARYGIRVDSGTSSGTAVDTLVCAQISSNTAAGNAAGSAFGLRKQGTVSTTNTYGLVGLAPSPATAAQTVTYVNGQNPASPTGTLVISGDNFVSCSLPF